jgi:type VI protein secretion system component Hcp
MSNEQSKSATSQDTELTPEQLEQVSGGVSVGEIVITKPTDTTSPK